MTNCYTINDLSEVFIGYPAENNARRVSIDVSDWMAEFRNSEIAIAYIRPSENIPYLVNTEIVNGQLIWTVTSTDVAIDGTGYAIIQMTQGRDVLRSARFSVVVGKTLDGSISPPPEPPTPAWMTITMALTGGRQGQVLTKKSDDDYDTEWTDVQGGRSGAVWYPTISDDGDISWSKTDTDVPPTPKNIKGEKGDDGTEGTDGKSAYESAIDGGYTGTESQFNTDLAGVSNKQNIISDLSTIRSGAALGATAVQPETGKGLFSGSYNDLTNKPTIPDELADLGSDSTHRTVTDTEKATWNSKGTYSKPTGGIPASDMSSAVQTSLGRADTALQSADISGKENTSNKVTSLSSSSTDTQYPSAKCVYDLVGNIENALEALL